MKNLIHYLSTASLTFSQLSKKSEIPEDRLRAIAEERLDPSYFEIRRMSDVLNLPVSFLLSEFHQEEYTVLFRKTFGSDAEPALVNKFNYVIENVISLAPDVSKVENFRLKIQPVQNNYANAEALAFFFREEYLNSNQLDPIIDLPTVLSNKLNFVVKAIELGSKTDGASASVKNFIFLFVSPRFEGRMLFTLAHELAHVINHHEEGDYFYLDKNINLIPRNDKNKNESFANAFASCLLLPEKGVALMIKKIREIYKINADAALSDVEILFLSRFYGVSFDVAASRCEAIGLLPKGGAYSLSQQLKTDYYSAEKRADKLGLPPRPEIIFPSAPNFLLDRAIKLIDEEKISIGKIADMLSISVNTILDYHSKIV